MSLQQLKQRVDSIQKGIREAKVIYANCLQSLEEISDDIHQKRKHRKSVALIANLQRRESGVGADSEDDVSLDQSQLDLDLDCEASLKDVEGVFVENLLEPVGALGEIGAHGLSSGSEGILRPFFSADSDLILVIWRDYFTNGQVRKKKEIFLILREN